MKNLLLVFALLLFAFAGANAQQDARYSQYMFNKLAVNPAYSGTTEGLSLTGLYRIQWVDIDGAPTTFSFAAHTPFGGEKKAGLGFWGEYDQIGIHNRIKAYLSYAYKIDIGSNRLSLGVQGGVEQLNSAFSSLQGNTLIELGIDPVLGENQSNLLPNFGVGLYFYNPDAFYFGVAAPHLLNNDLYSEVGASRQISHYNIMGGVIIGGDTFKVKPSFLLKATPNMAPVQLDANLMFLIKNAIWLGGSFRAGSAFPTGAQDFFIRESLDFIVAFEVKGLKIGYAYDLTLSDLARYNSGSHEIMLGYDVSSGNNQRIRTPRYF
ncbi:MAG: PorP/SprF family type IX secretion system membrane protein [Chitinophagales bacterium]